MAKRRQTFECWCIRLKGSDGGENFIASTNAEFLAFNTLKFGSYAAALAHARRHDLHPADHEIVRAKFRDPDVLEVREIDYSIGELALAK